LQIKKVPINALACGCLWGSGVLPAIDNLDHDVLNNLGRLRTPNKVGMAPGFNFCFSSNCDGSK